MGTRSTGNRHFGHIWLRPQLLFLAVVSATAGWSHATSVRALEIDEVVRASDQIFLGRLVAVGEGRVPGMDLPYTEYRFAVAEWIKGGTGQTVSIRQMGTLGRAPLLAGLPSYRKGQEIVLCLYKPSRVGLTSPVGMQQGYYPVERDAGGERFVRLGVMSGSVARLRAGLKGAATGAGEPQVVDRVLLDEFLSLLRAVR